MACQAAVLALVGSAWCVYGATEPRSDAGADRGPGLSAGRVAVLADAAIPASEAGASDPKYLAGLLRRAGCEVTLLGPDGVSDPSVLSAQEFGLVVLPYGPWFPAGAVETFRGYLAQGGSFLSTGGLAFDRLYPTGGQARLNTRGLPGGIDRVPYDQDHLGVFESLNGFADVARVAASENQFVAPGGLSVAKDLEGFSAAALTGTGEPSPTFSPEGSRWVPILDGFDRAGSLRARIGAIVYHYAGRYRDSRWGLFGATSADLFSEGSPLAPVFTRTVQRLLQGVFAYDLRTSLSCYRQGEPVEAQVCVRNPSLGGRDGLRGVWTITDRTGAHRYATGDEGIGLEPSSTSTVSFRWAPSSFDRDFYRVRFDLLIGTEPVDRVETAFVVWDPGVFRGFRVSFADSQFRLNGHEAFLAGCSGIGQPFQSGDPLTWDGDFTWMADNGLSMYRIMHYSVLFDEAATLVDVPEADLRKLDAMLQLAASHRIVLFLAAHAPWQGRKLHPLEQEGALLEKLGLRYRDVTSLVFDTDFHGPKVSQGRPASPEECLRTDKDALRRAQSRAPLAEQFNNTGRWPSEPAALAGNVDLFSYMLYPQDTPDFSSQWLLARDYRALGKSITLSEFGCSTDRRLQWSADPDTVTGIYHDWMHVAFAHGVSSVLHWELADESALIFPWGLLYNDRTAKPQFASFRNTAAFLRSLRVYRGTPPVCLLLRPGERGDGADIASLLGAMGNFTVLSEEHLAQLPTWVRVLVSQGPPSAAARDAVEGFLGRGGVLCIYGGAPGESQAAGSADGGSEAWLPGLLGVELSRPGQDQRFPFALSGARLVRRAFGERTFRFSAHSVRCGQVLFDPSEDGSSDRRCELLRAALESAGKTPSQIDARSWQSVAEWCPLFGPDGATVDMVKARREGTITLRRPGGPQLSVAVRAGMWGVVHWDGDGQVTGVEAGGTTTMDGVPLVAADMPYKAVSLDGNGIGGCGGLLLLPDSGGEVNFRNDRLNAAYVGEVRHGRWATSAELPLRRQRGLSRLSIPDGYHRKLLLLVDARKAAEMQRQVEQLLR